ncbi:hypothetical protein HDU76_011677, partial [Blyttiomyces sp. JEL0837]
MAQNEQLPRNGIDFITGPLLYYDFSNTLEDRTRFNTVFQSLCRDIHRSIQDREDAVLEAGSQPLTSPDRLVQLLQPIDFGSDLEKFQREYVPNTRTWAIKEVHQWLTEQTTPLLWLNGGAGLGKSVIAYLISQNVPPNCKLGSVFFCKHDDDSKNNAIKIVTTMANDLASLLPAYRDFLIAAMEKDAKNMENGEISVLDMPSTAFEHLIIKGLRQIRPPENNVVIVIDALDEIAKQGDHRRDFLNLIRERANELPQWVRVFVTSRPELDIFEALNG